MGVLGKILSSPVSSLIDSVGGVLDNLTTSDAERLEARRKLLEIERSFHRSLLEAEAEWGKTQADVIKTEATSQSVLARNWRPLLMLTFTYIIAHNFVIATLFSLPVLEIPPDMWGLLKIGIGGYIFGRSAEKTIPGVVNTLRK